MLSFAVLTAALAGQGLQELGQETWQDIEPGLCNRVAESRLRRATAAADASGREDPT